MFVFRLSVKNTAEAINTDMDLFGKAFQRTLNEDVTGLDPDAEAAAFGDSLDDGTSPDDFGVDAPNPAADDALGADAEMSRLAAQQNERMHAQLRDWIVKLDEFAEFLNGVEGQSIQAALRDAIPDTVFDKMKSAETKKIARVAMEVSSLAEQFKGYLATADQPKYRYV